jgi:hypothetical protein
VYLGFPERFFIFRPLCYLSPVKILLVAINAKYVQTNLAIRLLSEYAAAYSPAVGAGLARVEYAEWNINQLPAQIVRGIFEARPQAAFFSTYIWNRDTVIRVAEELRKLLPAAIIGFGGPEVSWSAERFAERCPAADCVISGEGEETFLAITERLADSAAAGGIVSREALLGLPGLYVRGVDGLMAFGGLRPEIAELDRIPFPYRGEPGFEPENRIVYYESSRGCPFTCAYCLSSIDRHVRYYSMDRVLADVSFFLENGWPLVKFVDRTFNLDPDRYLAIWRHIRDHHNGKTLFHFEIAAEYLTDEAFAVLETMPEGSVQFEIGIQSSNAETLRLVGRKSDLHRLAESVRRIPRAIHTHVDLIAGLPAEDLTRFATSFDFAFALGADMLQLGFLKVLAGSPMEGMARASAGYAWSDYPPYEVLATPVLPYADLLAIKDVETVLDGWYNSGLMRHTIDWLCSKTVSAFATFGDLAGALRAHFPGEDLTLPRRPADLFDCMAAFLVARGDAQGVEWLKVDYLTQGKPGVFPGWFERRYSKARHDEALVSRGVLTNAGASRRLAYAQTEYEEIVFPDRPETQPVLFVYGGSKSRKKRPEMILV